jgi:hypothetical protein
MPRAALLEQRSLEFEELGVFAVCKAKEGAPARFVRHSAFQPEFVDTVAGSVAIALEDAIQTQEDLIRPSGLLNCGCETEWTPGDEVNQRPIRPFGRRPILRRIKACLVADLGAWARRRSSPHRQFGKIRVGPDRLRNALPQIVQDLPTLPPGASVERLT